MWATAALCLGEQAMALFCEWSYQSQGSREVKVWAWESLAVCAALGRYLESRVLPHKHPSWSWWSRFWFQGKDLATFVYGTYQENDAFKRQEWGDCSFKFWIYNIHELGSRKVAHWTKCSPCKHKDQDSSAQQAWKSQADGMHACNPSNLEAEKRREGSQQPSLLD